MTPKCQLYCLMNAYSIQYDCIYPATSFITFCETLRHLWRGFYAGLEAYLMCTMHIYLITFLRFILSFIDNILDNYLFYLHDISSWIYMCIYLVLSSIIYGDIISTHCRWSRTVRCIFCIFENRISRGVSTILYYFYLQRTEFDVPFATTCRIAYWLSKVVHFQPLAAQYIVCKQHHKLEGVVQECWTSIGVVIWRYLHYYYVFTVAVIIVAYAESTCYIVYWIWTFIMVIMSGVWTLIPSAECAVSYAAWTRDEMKSESAAAIQATEASRLKLSIIKLSSKHTNQASNRDKSK